MKSELMVKRMVVERKRGGVSQRVMSVHCGVSRGSLVRYEKCFDMPISVFVSYCEKLGKNVFIGEIVDECS